ncbi:hypothetical protein FACS189460_5520 [Deltaproteobacteria bacterium]|nr:hypothetical protein FACS189460_5520 [Deltaproteobacteria bacterium]
MGILGDMELVNLFKGLIVAEQCFTDWGGSANSSKFLYREIIKRGLDNNQRLADFALRKSNNPYVPFDTGMRPLYITIDEFRAWKCMRDLNIENFIAESKRRHHLRQERKEKRKAATSELRKLSYEERNKIIKDLSNQFQKATVNEKLELMANDQVFPPEYYPKDWIKITEEEIFNLPLPLASNLRYKLFPPLIGEWKRFAQKLRYKSRIY